MSDEIVGYENLHLHTEGSLLDGYGKAEEYASRAKKINQQFLCVTDHGMMNSIPRQIKACEKNKINPIFGVELYVHPKQPEVTSDDTISQLTADMSPTERKDFRKSFHLLGIALNNVGYKNLVKLTSWGWTKGFYGKPRVNHEQLLKYKEGVLFTSCCYNSEVGQAFDRGGEDAGFQMIEKYMAMFGKNFYLEIMFLDFNKQKPYDIFILKAHAKYGIPIIVTTDAHYAEEKDSHMQRLMLMVQTGKVLGDIQKAQTAAAADGEMLDFFELQDKNLWMKSEEEINAKWRSGYSDVIDYEIVKQAKLNTVDICNRAKGVKLDRSIKLPEIESANDKLMDYIWEGFNKRELPKNQLYLNRIKEEYTLICQKEFSSYFIIQKMMTDEARRKCKELLGYGTGYEAVGPGRGSGVSSLVNYCLGVTDVNPVEHDLLFSRFLSPARGGKTMKLRFASDPISQIVEEVVSDPNEAPF